MLVNLWALEKGDLEKVTRIKERESLTIENKIVENAALGIR